MNKVFANPLLAMINKALYPDVLPINKPYNKKQIDIKWHNHNPTTGVTLYYEGTQQALYLLSNIATRNGTMLYSSPDIQKTYKFSWILTPHGRDMPSSSSHNLSNWVRTFTTTDSYKVKEITITNKTKITTIDRKALIKFIEEYNPYKNFKNTNYIPKILKEKYGTNT